MYKILWRAIPIILGVFSAVAMARDSLDFELNDYLNNIVNIYSGGLEYVALIVLDPTIKAAFAKVRELYGLDLQLLPHWKHLFILLWVFCGSMARGHTYGYLSLYTVSFWVWGFICAASGGVLGGTVQLSQVQAFVLPWIALIVYSIGTCVIEATDSINAVRSLERGETIEGELDPSFYSWLYWFWYFLRKSFGYSFIAVTFAAVLIGYLLFPNSQPALLALTAFVLGQAIIQIGSEKFSAASRPYYLGDDGTKTPIPLTSWLGQMQGLFIGLDILAVFGIAAVVVWIGRHLPS